MGGTRTSERTSSQTLFEKVVEQLPYPVVIVDPRGQPEYFNTAFQQLLGYTPEDIPTTEDWFRLAYPDPEIRRELLESWTADTSTPDGGLLGPRTLRATCKDGSQRDLTMVVQPHADGRLVVVMIDDTERIRAEEERARLLAQMLHMQKLESLGVLAGGIAHDFNNILVAVTSYADLALRQPQADPTTQRYLTRIGEASLRLAELTEQMLAYAGRVGLEAKPLDLDELVADIGQLLAVSVSKNARLHYQLAGDLPPVEGDPSQLRQVVMNLILNASDAVAERGGKITVTTELAHADRERLASTFVNDDLPAGDYLVLSVADDGPGIPTELQPRIFEPFYTTKFSGRGLGLAAVLGIVRSHRGAIEVTSQPHRGTVFRVFLQPSPTAQTAGASAPATASSDQQSWTVLVVDDEEAVGVVIGELLEAAGHRAVAVLSGREALAALREDGNHFDAVILDLTMPGMSGQDCLRELRSLRPDLPVILTSGYAEIDVRNALHGQPPAAFLKKPFDFESLLAALRTALA